MKTMKNLFVIGLTSVICASFAACGSDDEPEIKLPTIFEGKSIAQCEWGNNGYIEKSVYNYDNGKLISYSEFEISGNETYEDKNTIEYSGNQVKISWKDGSDSEICTYTLNESGFAISALLVTKEEDDVWDTNYTFEYDANGYLTKITERSSDETNSVVIKWVDGDALSYSKNSLNYVYTYNSDLNKGGILPPDNAWLDMDAELSIAYYAGILGRPTKHLIASQEQGSTETYEYTLDSEGYVKSCTSNENNSSYTYNYTFK